MKYNQLLKVSALLSSIFLVSQKNFHAKNNNRISTTKTASLLFLVLDIGSRVEGRGRREAYSGEVSQDTVAAKSLVLVRPPAADGSNKATNVSLSYNQIVVHEVDDSNGYISVSMWESMVWTDKRLSWKPDDYDGVDKITIPPSYIWLPAISVYTPSSELGLAEDETGRKVVIAADGNVVYVPTKRARFRCDVDLKLFPYDIQVCHLKVGSWVHHQKELNIIGRNFGLHLTGLLVLP
ncbi:hypothetical protein EB796_022911 [Bugula neritina]|uniref:Neurotransmitter-gated ion-channel ligand-binding domain-containing protein n=1 Tax=Bugula neritina TaxID=10212 RepID=A0A7J7IYY4_BUGNE|nr:hypothetical protein EB796_022911 [Bugula neritina]